MASDKTISETGLVHVYCGDGKGKTTAAIGLCARAAGSGKKVLFVQFFKDGSSAENVSLRSRAWFPRSQENVETMHEPRYFGRVVNMGQAEFSLCRSAYSALFERALRRAAEENFDLLVLDEAVSACNHGAIDEKQLLGFLKARPAGLEVVLTGRDPSQELMEAADYVTEMKKFKHPFESGIAARRGIEF